jgi:phenylacetate-CoA ligase
VTPSGKIVHALAVIYGIREIPAIESFQVLQDDLMNVLIRIVAKPEFSNVDEKRLVAKTAAALGEGVDVSIEKVSAIPTAPSGKFRYVISKAVETRLASFTKPQ